MERKTAIGAKATKGFAGLELYRISASYYDLSILCYFGGADEPLRSHKFGNRKVLHL